MSNYQYMKIPLNYFIQEIREEYDIMNLFYKRYVYIEIRRGMYGIKDAGILAFNYVVENLAPYVYHPVKYIAGFWEHETRNTIFVLCADFVIKYDNQDDLDHLLNTL